MDRNLMLINLAQDGNSHAQDILCRENIRLVQSIAARFTGRGTELCDLVQIGSLGLIKAIKGFDLTRGLKFSTYAVPVITGEIKRYLRDDGLIHISRGLKERRQRAACAEEELRRSFAREPTISEVAAKCGITVGELLEAYEACAPVESIDTPSDNNLNIKERIGTECVEDKIVDKVMTSQLLSCLSDRERAVIITRYIRGKTQSETAREIGVSQVHVSRIEHSALRRMRAIALE